MSVCLCLQLSGKDGYSWSDGRLQRMTRRRGARRKLSPAFVCDSEDCWGSLGLPCVLLSVGGQSFVSPFFTAPRGQCCVSSLLGCRGWAEWWAQAQVCGDTAVVVDGGCFKVMFLPPFSAPCSSLWLAGQHWCSRSLFSRDGTDGVHQGSLADGSCRVNAFGCPMPV